MTRRGMVVVAAGLIVALAGCGGDDEGGERFPALSSASPLEVTSARLAVGMRHGEALAMASGDPDNLKRATAIFPHAVLRVQSYDELAPSFGEYTAFQISSSETQRQASVFINAPAQGALDRRTDDLVSEVDAALSRAGATGFERRTVVVDLFRTRGDWYIRWDGVLDDKNVRGEGDYGLDRAAMVNDLLADIEAVATTHKPETIIIGVGVERLLATAGGEGLSQEEFSNFALFYRAAIARIKAASPDTRVGFDVQWDNFARLVTSLEVEGGAEDPGLNAKLDAAFTRWLLPLEQDSDVIALSATLTDDADGAARYQFLRRLPALYGLSKPIVFTSVRAPINNPALELNQRNLFDTFREWTAAAPVEWLAWDRLINIDGSTSQQPSGRCLAMMSETRPFNLDVSRCHDGMFDAIFQPKPLFLALEGQ